MATICVPDVKYFQHKDLTHIRSQPHIGSLRTLSNDLKAKSSSVPNVLDGGVFGHLGLLLTDTQYTTMLHILFDGPTNPGDFTSPAVGTTAALMAEICKAWRDNHYTFELCCAVEKPLISQVFEAIDTVYSQHTEI